MSFTQPGQLSPENFKWQEGPKYHLRQRGHYLFIVKKDIAASDIADVCEKTVHLALYEDGPVLFLLYKLGENEWEEVPYTWHGQRDEEKDYLYLQEGIIEPFEYCFCIILAAPSGAQAAVRKISLSENFAETLHNILLRQSASMFNAQSFGKHLHSVYNRLDISDMVTLSKSCFKSM